MLELEANCLPSKHQMLFIFLVDISFTRRLDLTNFQNNTFSKRFTSSKRNASNGAEVWYIVRNGSHANTRTLKTWNFDLINGDHPVRSIPSEFLNTFFSSLAFFTSLTGFALGILNWEDTKVTRFSIFSITLCSTSRSHFLMIRQTFQSVLGNSHIVC